MVGSTSQLEHATRVQELQQCVSLVRPHLPDGLYEQYRRWSAFVGKVQMKVVRQVAAGIFRPWTELDDGAPDLPLRDLASQILSAEEIEAYWAGDLTWRLPALPRGLRRKLLVVVKARAAASRHPRTLPRRPQDLRLPCT
jgi:hypothetical protein